MGLALAYNLARAGGRGGRAGRAAPLRIAVLEASTLASGASGRNGGGLRQQWSTELNIRLMQESMELCAGFAADPQNLARLDVERNVVQCPQRAVASRKFDDQVLHLQQGAVLAHPRSLGLSASRSQSPSRLTLSAISTSMAPGKIVIHHSPENR